ncbi:unnamed protein product [Scytosiphon promiscuus]
MTRSRFFSSSDDRKGEPSVALAAAPISAAQASITPGGNSSSSSSSGSSSSSASRWRRPRLRRSHAHQFSETLLAEKPAAIAPALSRDSLGSGYTEAPSSRGTSAETLSACSPAAEVLSEGSLQVDDFDLDGAGGPSSCEEDDLSWLDEDMPAPEEGGRAAAATGDSDGEFDEFVHHRHRQPQQQRPRYSGPLELCVQDFECGECIGKGSYSRVYLGNHAPTRTEWALKVVSKRKTFETRENLAHLREEKYISTKLQGSDFLVRTAGTFQNPRSVVFAMEYLPGGDLYQRLSDKGTLSLGEAVAWTAQAVLAIEDLHGKNIVHRDIKPGTAQYTHPQMHPSLESEFGTPEYVAPEVLNGCGHGMAVDLWALGVLIYELLVGQTPFKSSTVDEMYERIAAGDYAFPAPPVAVARKRIGSSQRGPSTKTTSKSGKKATAAKSSPLCSHVQQKALLCLSPARRPTLVEIKRHPFFAGVDFDGLRAAVRAQAEQEEEDAVVAAAIDGGDVWVRGQPVVCRSEELDDNYGGVFEGF